jgi:5-methylcytosine-specific restriction endonuclease McrA
MSSLLDRSVLVLNRHWQPVQTCSVRRSLKLLCLGHAQVVQTAGEQRFQTHDLASWIEHSLTAEPAECVHGVRVALRAPWVIVLTLYDRIPRKEVKFTRRNVFLRDKFTCQYCAGAFAESELNLDHVVPRDKGGRTTWENIVTSCVRCNTRKANKMPHEVEMYPLRKPAAPRWRPLFGMREAGHLLDNWADFLEPSRDSVKLSA